jgi:hypothetical protein
MGKFPFRRFLASAMLCVVGVGGGGMPTLDALVFHGPTRRAESFRSHYEASDSCHADGCSIRSDVQPRSMGDRSPQAPLVVAVALVAAAPFRESVVGVSVSLRYFSRAPPRTA